MIYLAYMQYTYISWRLWNKFLYWNCTTSGAPYKKLDFYWTGGQDMGAEGNYYWNSQPYDETGPLWDFAPWNLTQPNNQVRVDLNWKCDVTQEIGLVANFIILIKQMCLISASAFKSYISSI